MTWVAAHHQTSFASIDIAGQRQIRIYAVHLRKGKPNTDVDAKKHNDKAEVRCRYLTSWDICYGNQMNKSSLLARASIFSIWLQRKRCLCLFLLFFSKKKWFQHIDRGGVRVTVCRDRSSPWRSLKEMQHHRPHAAAAAAAAASGAQNIACQYCPCRPFYSHQCIYGHVTMFSTVTWSFFVLAQKNKEAQSRCSLKQSPLLETSSRWAVSSGDDNFVGCAITKAYMQRPG